MAKPFAPRVVTANRLRTGDVVYLAANDDWVAELAAATVAHNAADLAALKAAAGRAEATQAVVSVYEIDVDVSAGAPRPTSVKERIRAAHRPTV